MDEKIQLSEKDILRFWKHVDKEKSEIFCNGERCWEWKTSFDGGGYGSFQMKLGSVKAHRVSWIIFNGIILEDKPCVLHHCDNRKCVNPSHLFLGTYKDNVRDMESKGRGIHPSGDLNGSRTHPEKLSHQKGEVHGRAKLNNEKVLEIRGLYDSKEYSQNSLANMFNVSQAQIGRIVRNQRWTHI